MPAPKGNKNACKWTEEKANDFFDKVLHHIKENEDCCSLAEATVEAGYYETVAQYLQEKFEGVDFESFKKAMNILKARIIKRGLEHKYNATMSIFMLKNNHGMQEKIHNENTVTNLVNLGNGVDPEKESED